MDFVFVEDVARANLLATKSAITDDVINIASGTETSLTELADTLARVMGVDIPHAYGPARKVNPVARRLAEVSKAERLLNFKTEDSLEEGLRKLVDWWARETNHPDFIQESRVGAC
jgi:UDP-glucose 4-epimerase